MAKSRFQRGSGCFKCRQCGVQTRDTGDNGSLLLCPLCEAKSSWGNHLIDNGLGCWSDLDSCTTVEQVETRVEMITKAAFEKPEGIFTVRTNAPGKPAHKRFVNTRALCEYFYDLPDGWQVTIHVGASEREVQYMMKGTARLIGAGDLIREFAKENK